MIINIKVITRSSENKIKEEGNGLKVYLTTVPEKSKANLILTKLLANYYKISKSKIKIIKGKKNKNKVIEVL